MGSRRPISPVEMSPPRRVEEIHSIDDEQIPISPPYTQKHTEKVCFLYISIYVLTFA